MDEMELKVKLNWRMWVVFIIVCIVGFLTISSRIKREKNEAMLRKEALDLKTSVAVSGAEEFVAADYFQIGNKEVIFGRFDEYFRKLFLNKKEKDIKSTKLNVYALKEGMSDKEMLSDFGKRAEIGLAHLYDLLRKQPKGEPGALIVSPLRFNIFYVRAVDGNICPIFVHWDRGWYLDVPMERFKDSKWKWFVGTQVFAR